MKEAKVELVAHWLRLCSASRPLAGRCLAALPAPGRWSPAAHKPAGRRVRAAEAGCERGRRTLHVTNAGGAGLCR